ncbi:hypothetical protein [Escherichia marmotae]|uniref:Uncharacterized protein n=1 Tax=Escherichia marmotae TaxID=1499973 RepID=A0A7L6L393_9ESCH|nr:hypothetical protein [Escherichia marmotae]MEC9606605.1 hypothetical protein [Escherichia marmotae]MED0232843.1 hypothetical protein [Escherichia marmotae]MED0542117.1 hypothetical protein [Escherichia marmotae]MED8761339.1 hypothetical protein [Escherichia marmotae]MED8805775.1 hypothetical protein [Escherichia marmotae]
MNHTKIVSSLFVFIPFVLHASAPCSDIQLSSQVFLCSKVTFEHSDSELNNTYKNLLSMIRKEYSAQPDLGVEYIEKNKIIPKSMAKISRQKLCSLLIPER